MLRLLLPLLLIALASAAQAEVYKCQINSQTVYTDQACPGQGVTIETPDAPATPAPAAPGIDAGIQALAESYRRDVRRSYEANVAANAARSAPREVPGVACPSDRAIEQAIEDREIALCMTPQEVEAAEPIRNDEQQVFNKLLPTGPSVVEWVYDPDPDWPTVVRFDNNHVIGYTWDTSEYNRSGRADVYLHID